MRKLVAEYLSDSISRRAFVGGAAAALVYRHLVLAGHE